MWLLELILTEKDYRPFWTNAYKELSVKLSSPTEIVLADSDLISSNLSSKNREVKLPSLMTNKIKVVNRNSPKTCYQLSTSSVVDKWESEATAVKSLQKTLKVKLHLNQQQKIIINEWIDTCRYLYNKTIEIINKDNKANKYDLRDLLVTENTKKGSNEYKSFDILKAQLTADKKNINKELAEIKKLINKNNNDKNLNNKLLLIQQKLADKIAEIESVNQQRRDNVKTIKPTKNPNIKEWETRTPKAVRACTVEEAVDAYTAALAQKKLGLIKFFNLKYRKKANTKKCITVPPSIVSFNTIKNKKDNKITTDYTKIKIAPDFFGQDSLLTINKHTAKRINKKYNGLTINHESKITKFKNEYYIHIPVDYQPKEVNKLTSYCGVDPGIRTLLTVFNNNDTTEYKHNKQLLNKLNYQLDMIKSNKKTKRKYTNDKLANKLIKINQARENSYKKSYNNLSNRISNIIKHKKKRIRKKAFNKREIRKANLINEVHWLSINKLLDEHDVILYGDIKSHDIAKCKKNKHLKRAVNDLKFYNFKQKLLYKAEANNKLVLTVNESFTTKTCSFCGTINHPGYSEIYSCSKCNKNIGRDINAAKNILMKGIIEHL